MLLDFFPSNVLLNVCAQCSCDSSYARNMLLYVKALNVLLDFFPSNVLLNVFALSVRNNSYALNGLRNVKALSVLLNFFPSDMLLNARPPACCSTPSPSIRV